MASKPPHQLGLAPSTPESHVQVRTSPTSGNGLFATKDIPAGSTLLLKPRPLIGELDIGRLEDTCHNCYTMAAKSVMSCAVHNNEPGKVEGCEACEGQGMRMEVKACTGCKKVKYCSKTCQKQAWTRYHKQECKLLRNPDLPPLPNSVRAAVQLASLMSSFAASEEDKEGVKRLLAHEWSTYDQLNEVEQYETSVSAARDVFELLSPGDPEAVEIREYVGKILRNSLTLTAPTLDPVGIAFDPIACSANHSCTPNASVLFDVPRLMMRSLAPIKKDEEIFISYIDNTNPFGRRQAELQLRYCFKCACPKCQLGLNSREDAWAQSPGRLSAKWKEACQRMELEENFRADPANWVGDGAALSRMATLQGMAYKDLETSRAQETAAAAITDLEGLMRLCYQSKMWPITRQPYAAARIDIFAHMMDEGRVCIALFQAVKTYFLIDPVLYPQEFHPVRVVHTWGLVKCLMEAYQSPQDPNATPDSGIMEMFRHGFDFVVPMWKILKKLSEDVLKSHGMGSNLCYMVHSVASQMRNGIGMDGLREIERDPLGMWGQFEKYAYALEY